MEECFAATPVNEPVPKVRSRSLRRLCQVGHGAVSLRHWIVLQGLELRVVH